jgi:hypothetical protein
MYVLLWSTGHSVAGFDWFWLGLAALLDLSHLAASAWGTYEDRDRLLVYSTRTTA